MGHYNSQYESYYNSIVNRKGSNASNYNSGFYKSKKQNWIVRRFIRDLSGVLVLTVLVIGCKFIVTPQTSAVYNYSKNIIDNNFDYVGLIDNIKNTGKDSNFHHRIVELIDKIKADLLGGETIKDKIKNNFSLPVDGEVIDNESKGIDILSSNQGQVFASFDGKVKEWGEDKNLGKYVLLDHGEGIESIYSNLGEVLVKEESYVKKGDAIGVNKSPEELIHFEILYMGQNNGLERIVESNE